MGVARSSNRALGFRWARRAVALLASTAGLSTYLAGISVAATPVDETWVPSAPVISTLGEDQISVELPERPDFWVEGWTLEIEVLLDDEETPVTSSSLASWEPGSGHAILALTPGTAYKIRFVVWDEQLVVPRQGPFSSFSTSTSEPNLWTPPQPYVVVTTAHRVGVEIPSRPPEWTSSWILDIQVYSADEQALVTSFSNSEWTPGSATPLSGLEPETAYKVRFSVRDDSTKRVSAGPFASFTTKSETPGLRNVFIHRIGNLSISSSTGEITCPYANTSASNICYVQGLTETMVTLEAQVAQGWTFAGWQGWGCSGTGPCTFVAKSFDAVDENQRIFAYAIPDGSEIPNALTELDLPEEVRGSQLRVLDISDDGRYLLYSAKSQIPKQDPYSLRWRDLLTLEDILVFDNVYGGSMSGDGQSVVYEGTVWDAGTRSKTSYNSGVNSTISADGRFIAGQGNPASISVVYDRETGQSREVGGEYPVIAPDGSVIATRIGKEVRLYDPVTGVLQKVIENKHWFRVVRISNNGQYAFGIIDLFLVGNEAEAGFARLDLTTGELINVPRTTESLGCMGYRFSFTAPDAGNNPYFAMWGEGGTGPLPDGSWDFYGMYQASFTSTGSATSATGGVNPLPATSNDCPSVVATPDGQTVIFATERLIPSPPAPQATEAPQQMSVQAASISQVGATATAAPTSRLVRFGSAPGFTTWERLTINKIGAGSVATNQQSVSCGANCLSFPSGTPVSLTATASPGHRFVGWSGSACSGTGTCNLTMSSARSVTATFRPIATGSSLLITKSGTGSGTVTSTPAGISCGTTCSATLSNQAQVTLTATAATGSQFVGWSGACSGTGTCNLTMSSARSVTATFDEIPAGPRLQVSISGTGSGSVSSTPAGISCEQTCSANFTAPTRVTLSATPASGSRFVGWSGDCSGTRSCSVTMSTARNVTARFDVIPTFSLSVTTRGTGSGSVTANVGNLNCSASCSTTLLQSTRVTLTATPAPGSRFVGWSGACRGTRTCTVTMSAARDVSATFDQLPLYLLQVSRTPSGSGTVTSSPAGIACGDTCSASFYSTTRVTLTAVPADGYRFIGWSGACRGTRSCTVTMSAARSVTARFAPIT